MTTTAPVLSMGMIAEEQDTTSNDGSQASDPTSNIKVRRVTGFSMRHTKSHTASVLKEGWMVHYTNRSSVVRIGGEGEGLAGGGACGRSFLMV